MYVSKQNNMSLAVGFKQSKNNFDFKFLIFDHRKDLFHVVQTSSTTIKLVNEVIFCHRSGRLGKLL